MSRYVLRRLLPISVVFIVSTAYAQAPAKKPDAGDLKVADVAGQLDLSVPQSPAFTILGVTPEAVVKSDDLRTVATGLLHGVDPQGNLQSGIAIDVRPYLALVGDESTLGDYQKSRWVQIASSAQVSFATASGQGDSDKADRQALALNVKLWREHDPALGTSKLTYTPAKGPQVPARAVDARGLVSGTMGECYGDYLLAASSTAAAGDFPEDLDEATAKLAADARKTIAMCLAPFKKRYWNAGSLELAIAGYRSDVEGFSDDGVGAWLGYSHSIGERGQFIIKGAYTDNRLVAPKNANSPYTLVDETDAGARVRFGSRKGSLMLEGLWTRAKTAAADDEYWRASIGTEVMVLPDVWIELAIGKAFGTRLFDDDPVYSGQLRFGFSQKSLLPL
jgi:hypothetical protein